jgi:uncharacterized protein
MGRLLLLILLGLLIYLMVKGFMRSSSRRKADGAAPKPGERMVTCAHCGVHLPESDSVTAEGRHFCTEEHRRLGN